MYLPISLCNLLTTSRFQNCHDKTILKILMIFFLVFLSIVDYKNKFQLLRFIVYIYVILGYVL